MQMDISVQRLASVSGKRLFIEPNIFNQSRELSIPQSERKYDFVLRFPYTDIDSVMVAIPKGYHVEFLPEKIIIESQYGDYQSEIIADEGKITYIRKCSRVKGTFPAASYLEYVNFINKIAEADKIKVVLAKST